MLRQFPLQNKQLQRLTVPYMKIGVCETMNACPNALSTSFNVVNVLNKKLFEDIRQSSQSTSAVFAGEMVGAGLVDSYTGSFVSHFVSDYLSRALSLHTVVPEEIRKLRRQFPDDPLLEIMQVGLRRHGNSAGRAGSSGSSGPSIPGVSQARRSFERVTDLQTAETNEVLAVMNEWYAHQYATSADNTFFQTCNENARQEGSSGGEWIQRANQGSRAVWFTASVIPVAARRAQAARLQPQRPQKLEAATSKSATAPHDQVSLREAHKQPAFIAPQEAELKRLDDIAACQSHLLEVHVSGVGNCRAFGIARNSLTPAAQSALDPTRERLVPLSSDHSPQHPTEMHRVMQAGATVDFSVSDFIDNNPFYNVSRSFGHWSMKNDKTRAPTEQKLICSPGSKSWTMLEGDVLVLTNHAVFETRNESDSSIDELAKVVGRALRRGCSAEEAAAALCDFATHFGAAHSLQVIVAVATKPTADEITAAHNIQDTEPAAFAYDKWISPGPFYVEAFRSLPEYRMAVEEDCQRCGITLAQLLHRRWNSVGALLEERFNLPFHGLYGKEVGTLQQTMDEEAQLFADPVLLAEIANPGSVPHTEIASTFARLAKALTSSAKKQKR